ncbi:MAG TPA: two-component regulator propeller domain-containing protein [Flavisolibacter sp.]|nr:two-component regulator propeller domain-containing protein [Flavisolibacter sp.]
MPVRKLILFFAFFFPLALFSQSLVFNHVKISQGLSHSSVNAIYQDEFNQMWIATRDGLNRYDGYKIEIFRPAVDDVNGIFGNNIQRVTGDKKGKIYIQCMSGLVTYDLQKQKFKVIQRDGVRFMSYGKNKLWIGNHNQINYLAPGEDTIKNFQRLDSSITITSITEDSFSNLYVGTLSHGLLMVDGNGRSKVLIKNISVTYINVDKQQRVWVGSLNSGLYCIDTKGGVTNYIHNEGDNESIPNNFVRTICQDDLGYFWIGTYGGLARFDPETRKFKNFKYESFDSYSIGSSSIWSITKDIHGLLWIGTFFGGIDIINPEFSFNSYYRPSIDKKSLNSSIVSNVAEDEKGNLWIGTDDAGLNYFDRAKGTFSHYTHNPSDQQSISSNAVKTTLIDKENNCLWIGMHLGGLNKLDLTTRKVQRINLKTGKPVIDNYVRSIVKSGDSLLLGTHFSVYVYDIKTGVTTRLLHPAYTETNWQIWDMMLSADTTLWFATSADIYKYNLRSKSLKKYIYRNRKANIDENITLGTFFKDKKGRVWVGSANKGLGIYDSKGDSLRFFNTANSNIIDNYVLGINESPMGYLLIATNKGLSLFDVEKNSFYNYYNNFFPFESLNERSVFRSKTGEIFLCSMNGLLILSERDLMLKPKDYVINLTALYINNKLIKPEDEPGIINESILYADKIELDNSHSVLSVEFSTSNYIKALQPEIQYILEGFDDQWVSMHNDNNLITYTNLNPGKYVLKIKGVNKLTQQNIPIKELQIIVHPPFYKMWYAYLFYAMLVVAVLLLIYYQVRLKASLKYAQIEKKHIEDLNQYKLRFFTDVSHEIRTPVTLIVTQLDMLLQRSDLSQSIRKRLSNIVRNTNNLKILINELLDFRKQEQGYLQLAVSENDLIKYLEEIVYSFKDQANAKHIQVSFLHNEDIVKLWFDANQLYKVFFNLLSNALKFTPPNGKVSLQVERKDNWVSVSVSDTGIGIKKEEIENLFDSFYQGENVRNAGFDPGTGIGLALAKSIVDAHGGTISVRSNENNGSVFTVALPMDDSHFKGRKIEDKADGADYKQDLSLPDEAFLEEIQSQQQTGLATKSLTILIIEDNKELLQLLSNIFNSLYNVIQAENGTDGLKIAQEVKPDIILSDIMMPGMSGIELCKRVKSNLEICHIPVVLLSARTAAESNLDGLMAGADDYITKPFNTKLLLSRCNNLINNRVLLQKKFRTVPDLDTSQLAASEHDQELLNKAIKLIEENISNPDFNVTDFASKMFMGRSSLFSKLKALTGQTPKDFITTIRMKKGLAILEEKAQLPISEIASMVGFNDTSYFIKMFKQHFGVTPKQYRLKEKM